MLWIIAFQRDPLLFQAVVKKRVILTWIWHDSMVKMEFYPKTQTATSFIGGRVSVMMMVMIDLLFKVSSKNQN